MQSGEIVVSRRVKQVYARLAAATAETSGQYIFDETRANRPIAFIERFCKHSKGEWAGHGIFLELFQKAYIQALYGFVDRDSGCRQYRESFFLVGRKNGKSTLLAGLALYMLTSDGAAVSKTYTYYHVANSYKEAGLLAKRAGCDTEIPVGGAFAQLPDYVRSGELDGKYLDESVRRILTIKFKRGLFENPYADTQRLAVSMTDKDKQAVSREIVYIEPYEGMAKERIPEQLVYPLA